MCRHGFMGRHGSMASCYVMCRIAELNYIDDKQLQQHHRTAVMIWLHDDNDGDCAGDDDDDVTMTA